MLYPPPLQGSLKPLKNIMLLADLFRTLSTACRKTWISNNIIWKWLAMYAKLKCIIRDLNWIVNSTTNTHMAAKLSCNPVCFLLYVVEKFAPRGSCFVWPLIFWKYALLVASTYGHYHLRTSLNHAQNYISSLTKN